MFKVPRTTVRDLLEPIRAKEQESNLGDLKLKYLKNEPFGTYKNGQQIESDLGLKRGGHLELKLNPKGITKTVILSDIHLPYNIDLNPVFDFISDFKPDHVILNGDVADWDCFSPHEFKSCLNPMPFADQKALCLQLIEDLGHLCKTSITWIQGNHCDWLRQAVLRNPSLEGLIETHVWLPENVNFVPLNFSARLGKLTIIHGNWLRNDGARRPTERALQDWSATNLIFGHYHKHEVSTKTAEIDSEKRRATSSACLCKINPSYARNAPNAVTNGFVFTISEPSGDCWITAPEIIRGRFIAEGKVYGK